MRTQYKVQVRHPALDWRSILFTDDRGIAVHIADTRESGAISRVMDKDGTVIHEPENTLDVGQSLVGV